MNSQALEDAKALQQGIFDAVKSSTDAELIDFARSNDIEIDEKNVDRQKIFERIWEMNAKNRGFSEDIIKALPVLKYSDDGAVENEQEVQEQIQEEVQSVEDVKVEELPEDVKGEADISVKDAEREDIVPKKGPRSLSKVAKMAVDIINSNTGLTRKELINLLSKEFEKLGMNNKASNAVNNLLYYNYKLAKDNGYEPEFEHRDGKFYPKGK